MVLLCGEWRALDTEVGSWGGGYLTSTNPVLTYFRTLPLIATGLSRMACMPRMADWGGLMIGVPNMEPNTPPFDMVNVPPSMSSMANVPVRAC